MPKPKITALGNRTLLPGNSSRSLPAHQSTISFAGYSSGNAAAPVNIGAMIPGLSPAKVGTALAQMQEERRRAARIHREAVLKAYREHPVSNKPRVFGADWVAQQRRFLRYADNSPLAVAQNHGGGGRFDYNVTGGFVPEDRFMLNGRLVNKGALGNYAAGYGSIFGAGRAGIPLVMYAGDYDELMAHINGEQRFRDDNYRGFFDPKKDKNFIREGIRDALRDAAAFNREWGQQDEYKRKLRAAHQAGRPDGEYSSYLNNIM